MRVIHSALLLAKYHQIKGIKVLWKKDSGLNAGFFEIFKPVNRFKVIENVPAMAFYFYFYRARQGYHFFDDEKIGEYRFDNEYWGKDKTEFVFNTCLDFLKSGDSDNFYPLFKPVDTIQNEIEKITAKFNKNTVGVQIRRTDNNAAKSNSKTVDFISRMESVLAKKPDTIFFLSTDDKKVENELILRFPGKILTQVEKVLKRDSIEGIRNAVTDLYALSKTSFILGSFSSSFGEVASELGGIPFFTIRSNN